MMRGTTKTAVKHLTLKFHIYKVFVVMQLFAPRNSTEFRLLVMGDPGRCMYDRIKTEEQMAFATGLCDPMDMIENVNSIYGESFVNMNGE